MKKPGFLLLLIAYLGFISLGLPDATHGVNWPFVRETFAIPNAWLGMILTCTGIGYFSSSMSAGFILNRLGVGALLAGSSLLVFVALTGFAFAPYWAVFLLFAVLLGLGSGAIDTGLNAYAAEHFSTRQMNWLHAAFGVGAMTGPMIATTVLVVTGNWRVGYGAIGFILLLMAGLFFITRHQLDDQPDQSHTADEPDLSGGYQYIFRQSVVWFHILLFFIYTGVEIGVGQWAFTVLTEGRSIDTAQAGLWTSFFWGALAAGRVFFGVVVAKVQTDVVIRLAMWGTLVGTGVFCIDGLPLLSLLGLLVTGFCLAPIFPCLMSRTPQRVGKKLASRVIGIQVSVALIGGVSLPFSMGYIASFFGLESIGVTVLVLVILLVLVHEILMMRTRER
ncbi:MFS transporter [Gynuella sunshinyii]|uniref:Fucose permease n=1 Tax=Gynuella sunshinyii YC6258 TaxID=1445510 RepID=A0A0C5VRF8_9GAMM|nr:MFS transporter [Gynuella sunshinyii]AJQ95998.1 fucose permease [Gynuella sunshinyii YC6258]